jgi:hypothetical protein
LFFRSGNDRVYVRLCHEQGLLDDFKNLPNARVLEAASRGGRFTAADVSARAGCSLEGIASIYLS